MTRRQSWAGLLILSLVTVGAYWPGLSGGFMFDDITNIVENATLRLFSGSFSSLLEASSGGHASLLGRPVSLASFALNLYFSGENAFYFKLTNLLIHLANGVLVFVLVRALWPRLTRSAPHSHLAALWVSAAWLLHPINLMPVLFVVQRMTSLAAFFTLLALCLYFYARQTSGVKRWLSLAGALLVCWPLAVFSKETGLLLPGFILVCEWLALGGLRAYSGKTVWMATLALFIALGWALAAGWHIVTEGYAYRSFSLAERLMTEPRVLWLYLTQLFLPWPGLFSLYHDDFVISRGWLLPPQTLVAIVAGGITILWAYTRRKRQPLLAFAVAWFLTGHLLESTFFPLEIAYEHRNYLAALGPLLGLAGILFGSTSLASRKTARLVFALAFIAWCGFVTTLRAAEWGDALRRSQMEAALHPGSARANYEAALVIIKRMQPGNGEDQAYQVARHHLQLAAQMDADGKAALIGLLYLDCLAGKAKEVARLSELRERFARARFSPGDLGLVNGLSPLLVEQRLCLSDSEVALLLEAALSNPLANPVIRGMLYAAGMDYAIAKIHSVTLALDYAKAAVNSNPGSVPLRINLIRLLLAAGNTEEARQQYATLRGLRISPVDKPEVAGLGRVLADSR